MLGNVNGTSKLKVGDLTVWNGVLVAAVLNCLPYVRTSAAKRWMKFVGDGRICCVLLILATGGSVVYY